MKHTALRWIAVISALVSVGSTQAARRPRYGGELRIEMRGAPRTVDPAEAAPDGLLLTGAVFETLVRLDDHGDPQPWLATQWTHDAARKRWVFSPRTNVVLHNGAVWAPSPIEVPDDKPVEQILREMSRPKNSIVIRAADGSLAGTGPFRIARWEPGKSATLTAHEAYWGGRPYLDSLDIQMGREYADQAADLQLGKADVVEGSITSKRTAVKTTEVLALQFDSRVPDAIREAIALSIDRSAIHSVILQKQGAASSALLPQWLSGYSFVFETARNVARARQLVPPQTALAFSYDAKDALIRPVAQRIEVNVREAGIMMRPANTPEVKLVRLPVTSQDATSALEDMAAILKMPLSGSNPYEMERSLLDRYRVIPIVHLPRIWTLSPRVRNWPRLADVWLE
jgi:peptide/nickel transport system substrate-binding protein